MKVACDVDLCKPKKCGENCIYKKRVEELKDEDITVVNHSLLAKWPYTDKKRSRCACDRRHRSS